MNEKFPPHEAFLDFAGTMADRSREMLLAVHRNAPDIEIKPDASFVTATDKAVEAALREMIAERFPTHGIYGEEFENENTDAEFVWVLDPIDGTAAFVAGIPVFGTLIGLAWQGRPYLGVMDMPVTRERWSGVSHRFAHRDGNAIRVRSCASLEAAYVTCSNTDFMSSRDQERFARVRRRAQYVQYGGSCYAYGVLAAGRTDLAIDGGLDAVDLFACAAVIEGAGGRIADWDGDPLTLDMKGTVVAAGDAARLEETLSLLQSD